jgi:hypothetical protein
MKIFLFFCFVFLNNPIFAQLDVNQLMIQRELIIEPNLNPHKTIDKIFSNELIVVLNEANAEINEIITTSFNNFWTFNSFKIIYSNEIPKYIEEPSKSFLFFGYISNRKNPRSTAIGGASLGFYQGYGFAIADNLSADNLNNLKTLYCEYIYYDDSRRSYFQQPNAILDSISFPKGFFENEKINNYWNVLDIADKYLIPLTITRFNDRLEKKYEWDHGNKNVYDPKSKYQRIKLDGMIAGITLYEDYKVNLLNNEILILDNLIDSLGFSRLKKILPNSSLRIVSKDDILEVLIKNDKSKLIACDVISFALGLNIRKVSGELCATTADQLFSPFNPYREINLKRYYKNLQKSKKSK